MNIQVFLFVISYIYDYICLLGYKGLCTITAFFIDKTEYANVQKVYITVISFLRTTDSIVIGNGLETAYVALGPLILCINKFSCQISFNLSLAEVIKSLN